MTLALSINDLPDDVLAEIFKQFSGEFLCKTGSVVCRRWNFIISQDTFWISKALNDKRLNKQIIKRLSDKQLLDPKQLYFKNAFNRNLLQNPCGNDGFKHWIFKDYDISFAYRLKDKETAKKYIEAWSQRIVGHSQLWTVEEDQVGTNKSAPLLNSKQQLLKNFATSHTFSGKLQVIDLNEALDCRLLAGIECKIEVMENFAARTDCGSRYMLVVYLLDEEFAMVDNFAYEERSSVAGTDGTWKSARHVFELGGGHSIRYVVFYHGGCDLRCWSGFYGCKVTNGSVKLFV